jgi:uncharacterized protein YciI
MKIRIPAIAVLSALVLSSLTFAYQNEGNKLVHFQMAIFTRGPKWETTPAEGRGPILQQHLANVLSMYESGKLAIAGPFRDDTNLVGIFIVRTASADEARGWLETDPAVKAGLMAPQIHPWWSEDIFKKPNMPMKLDTFYFGFLKKGPNRKDGDDKDPQIQDLQKAHIANITRLADLKKLVMAGPFGDDGELRGVFVFRVSSIKEAQDLAATDPMIKIDRLRIELHPWQVPAGVLPQ